MCFKKRDTFREITQIIKQVFPYFDVGIHK